LSKWYDIAKSKIPFDLPGESVHLEMSPVARGLSSESLKEAKIIKESAVAIHLIENKNELEILLTQRSDYKGIHGGQVSFPGGKKEDTDLDLEFTARRESFEETSLDFHAGETIGQITDIFIPVSGFRVAAFVLYHKEFNFDLRPDPREVAQIFKLPLSALLKSETLIYKNIQITAQQVLKDVPCFQYEEFTIWGATAILLNEVKYIFKDKT
jgi:8-oxo-dGTP pyrophosphatase MutT (NUDIX family)